MSNQEEVNRKLFTDFNGTFDGRLARVIPIAANYTSEWAGTAARYDCRIKIRYNKELMAQLEEGMMLAVRNFKGQSDSAQLKGIQRYTILVISKIWPLHYGLGGINDSHYYPLQMEIIEQAVPDWDTDDQSTMMVHMNAVPINHDLIVNPDGSIKFVKGFSYPLIGDRVHVINLETVDYIYNGKVKEAIGFTAKFTSPDPKKDPRIGILRMFQESTQQVPVYVDINKLVRYHFGVFSFTGGGKSNLMANLFRRIMHHTDDIKLVIFDISCEYPFLLADIFSNKKIKTKIILEEEAKTADDFAKSIVKPRDFENDTRADDALKQIYDGGNVTFIQSSGTMIPTYSIILGELRTMRERDSDKPTYVQAIDEIRFKILEWIDDKGISESDQIDDTFVDMLSSEASEIVEKYKVYKGAGLVGWATTRALLKEQLARARKAERKQRRGVTLNDIQGMLSGPERVICISIADSETIRDIVIGLTRSALRYRKKSFEIKPQLLFVFDEAQEFIPSSASGQLLQCSRAVERLLRQGRKYGLGGAIATQRIAYLNTNIMQQLHTFFVGTLPRPYDRTVVSSSFQIDISILDKTLEFPPGSWLLSSYIATGLDNVPLFVMADNSEDMLEIHLSNFDKS